MFKESQMLFGSEHPVNGLRALYEELDKKIDDFSRAAGLHCPEGCGTCCETFIPEVARPEADLIASHLLSLGHSLTLDSWGKGEIPGGCPFYKIQGDPYHCSIYPVRPLICRLFGYAGSRDKNGSLRFRPCRHMPVKLSEGLEISVEMVVYGRRLEDLSPGSMKDLIGDGVKNSLSRLLLLSRLQQENISSPDFESTG